MPILCYNKPMFEENKTVKIIKRVMPSVVTIVVSEKLEDFEPFHPERMASRILGMGDVVSLVERAAEAVDEADAKRMEDGMRKAVQLWETSAYWSHRAARAVAHAKYKERPDC